MLSLHVSLSLRTGAFSNGMAKGSEMLLVLSACRSQRDGNLYFTSRRDRTGISGETFLLWQAGQMERSVVLGV